MNEVIKGNMPLVSIVVISYKSSNTILETLDSIQNQTYKNIELIITDDSSPDDTVSKAKDWLSNYQDRFASCVLLESNRNTGVSGNLNRGFRAAKGEWIKYIAADDKLYSNCISTYVKFVQSNSDVQIVFSKMCCFGDDESAKEMQSHLSWKHFSYPQRAQYYLMLLSPHASAPTSFMRKELWEKFGGVDERIPFIEDWPFWIKLMRGGIKLYLIDEYTVLYRVHDSLSMSKKPSQNYLNSLALVKNYRRKCQKEVGLVFYLYSLTFSMSGRSLIKRFLLNLNPYHWYIKRLVKLCK